MSCFCQGVPSKDHPPAKAFHSRFHCQHGPVPSRATGTNLGYILTSPSLPPTPDSLAHRMSFRQIRHQPPPSVEPMRMGSFFSAQTPIPVPLGSILGRLRDCCGAIRWEYRSILGLLVHPAQIPPTPPNCPLGLKKWDARRTQLTGQMVRGGKLIRAMFIVEGVIPPLHNEYAL